MANGDTKSCRSCEHILSDSEAELLETCPVCSQPLDVRQDVEIYVTLPPLFGDGGL